MLKIQTVTLHDDLVEAVFQVFFFKLRDSRFWAYIVVATSYSKRTYGAVSLFLEAPWSTDLEKAVAVAAAAVLTYSLNAMLQPATARLLSQRGEYSSSAVQPCAASR